MPQNSENEIIEVPNRFNDPFAFEEIINLQEFILEKGFILDMGKISFIEPFSMVSFLLLGRNFLRSRGEKLKLVNIPLSVHQYLARMDFFKHGLYQVADPLNERFLLKRSQASSRLIEMTEIPAKERESVRVITGVIDEFRKRGPQILRFWMHRELVDYFVTVISELCQNVFEHSMDSGYFAVQTYATGRENIFRLVIGDSGIGIRQSFENRNKKIKYASTAELIERALTTPISSKRDFGFGLCQVNSIIERLRGTLYIRSGDASVTGLYRNRKEGRPFIFQKNGINTFNGTQISISLSA